jgi:hypothetical protein
MGISKDGSVLNWYKYITATSFINSSYDDALTITVRGEAWGSGTPVPVLWLYCCLHVLEE